MGKKKQSPPPAFATLGKDRHFTPIYDDQFMSPAFICLPPVALKVYMILRHEYRGNYTGNRVICTYDMICNMGISRNTISGAIRILEALGFISCDRGGLGNQPSVYRFEEKWKHIGTHDEARAIIKDVRTVIKAEEDARKRAKDITA